MRTTALAEASMESLISFAKKKENPSVTIIEKVSGDALEEVQTVAGRLRLHVLKVSESDDIAILSSPAIAKHMAKQLKRRCQYMYYDFVKRPKGSITIAIMTNFSTGWDIIRDNGFVTQAYDEGGVEIPAFIDANVVETDCGSLTDLGLKTYSYSLNIGRSGTDYGSRILRLSRHYYMANGVFHEARQCYYPRGDTPQETADRNRLEKLFGKWGHKCLPAWSKDGALSTSTAQNRCTPSICADCTDNTRCTGCGQSWQDRMREVPPIDSPINKGTL